MDRFRPIDHMLRFPDAVALARVAHENRLGSYVFQRNKKLFRFGDRHIVVVFPVNKQCRCVRPGHMFQRRALPRHVHQVALMQELSKLHFLVLVVVRHVVVANEIGDPGGWNRGLELIRLRDEPIRQPVRRS